MPKKRKWNDDYIRFGFTCNEKTEDLQKPHCMLCGTDFSNENMKPSKLEQHFNRRHGGANVPGHDVISLQAKKARFDSRLTIPELGFLSVDKPLLMASYQVAFKVAKSKKPHNIAEELIKPCLLEVAANILGNEARKKLELVPLSNSVIQNRISNLSSDILEQIISHMRTSPFKISLQLDESTDVSNCSQLIALVRYVHDGLIKENFLFCEELKTTMKAKDVFQCVKDFFAKYELDIQIIGSVCTDGAPVMLGNKSGFLVLMKQEIPHLQGTHCFLHRYALASKTLPPKLKKVLDISVKTINWIRSRSLNHRLFKLLCEDLESDHTVLLLHTEVRWLSRGRILTRFFKLREEIKVFLKERYCDLLDELESQEFNQILAYLSDIFTQINDLCVSLQGKNVNILNCYEKLNAFKDKLCLWCRRVKRRNLSNFPSLEEMVKDNESSSLIPSVCGEIVTHLEALSMSFDKYFDAGKLESSEEWIMNPYSFNLDKMSDDGELKEDLMELRSNRVLKMQFESKTLEEYWCSAMVLFPRLCERAVAVLIPFATTYLCESGFSTLLSIKTKSRNRLNAQSDMRVAISNIVPRFEKIISEKQEQKSH